MKQVKVSLPDDIIEKLQSAAEAHNLSLSTEIRNRLWLSLSEQIDDRLHLAEEIFKTNDAYLQQ